MNDHQPELPVYWIRDTRGLWCSLRGRRYRAKQVSGGTPLPMQALLHSTVVYAPEDGKLLKCRIDSVQLVAELSAFNECPPVEAQYTTSLDSRLTGLEYIQPVPGLLTRVFMAFSF